MKRIEHKRAFTLIELLVSVGIFAFMTALLVAKYGNFNQSVLLTNLAYDVALTLRTAQTYGLSVKSVDAPAGGGSGSTGTPPPTSTATPNSATFKTAYGVFFRAVSISCNYSATKFPLFADTNFDGMYTNNGGICSEPVVSNYNLKRGAYISKICVGEGSTCEGDVDYLNITYRRPDPEAIICPPGEQNTTGGCENFKYAEITISDPSGSLRKIAVHKNGQVEVIE